jgi:nicotinate-nucleotide adenylyltransferase
MRVEMLKLAIENQPGLICDTRELDRDGRSYMVDTLRSLYIDFPDQTLLLFIGCDAFHSLMTWHQWRQLFDYAHIVVMTRPGFETQELDEFFKSRRVTFIKDLTQSPAGKLFFQPVTSLAISSTAIRFMIAEKQSPGFLLPDAVLDYIKQNRLYEQQ